MAIVPTGTELTPQVTVPTTADPTETEGQQFTAAFNKVALGLLAPMILDIVQDTDADLDDLDTSQS